MRGIAPDTGKVLWFHPYENGPAVNVAQPILFEDGRVFISAIYGVGSAMIRVKREGDTWKVDTLWGTTRTSAASSPAQSCAMGTSMVSMRGFSSASIPRQASGAGSGGRYYHGQLMLTNGLLVILTEDGRCVFVKPSPDEHLEVGQFQALPTITRPGTRRPWARQALRPQPSRHGLLRSDQVIPPTRFGLTCSVHYAVDPVASRRTEQQVPSVWLSLGTMSVCSGAMPTCRPPAS